MDFPWVYGIASMVIAYLCGSIPTSVWWGKAFLGVDVREHGSHNAGATNTFRVLGTEGRGAGAADRHPERLPAGAPAAQLQRIWSPIPRRGCGSA